MSWFTKSETCPVCENTMPTEPTPLAYVDTSDLRKTPDQQHFVKPENYAETCGECGAFEGQNLSDIKQGNIGEF